MEERLAIVYERFIQLTAVQMAVIDAADDVDDPLKVEMVAELVETVDSKADIRLSADAIFVASAFSSTFRCNADI